MLAYNSTFNRMAGVGHTRPSQPALPTIGCRLSTESDLIAAQHLNDAMGQKPPSARPADSTEIYWFVCAAAVAMYFE